MALRFGDFSVRGILTLQQSSVCARVCVCARALFGNATMCPGSLHSSKLYKEEDVGARFRLYVRHCIVVLAM